MRIVRHLVVQSREVEPIKDKVLIDLAEILVPFGRKEPRDPLSINQFIVIIVIILLHQRLERSGAYGAVVRRLDVSLIDQLLQIEASADLE